MQGVPSGLSSDRGRVSVERRAVPAIVSSFRVLFSLFISGSRLSSARTSELRASKVLARDVPATSANDDAHARGRGAPSSERADYEFLVRQRIPIALLFPSVRTERRHPRPETPRSGRPGNFSLLLPSTVTRIVFE